MVTRELKNYFNPNCYPTERGACVTRVIIMQPK